MHTIKMVDLQRQYNSIKQPIDLGIRSVVEKSDFIIKSYADNFLKD